MPITAAAAWALYSATQCNARTRSAAFQAGALEPLLLLIEGGGAQVRSQSSIRLCQPLPCILSIDGIQGTYNLQAHVRF